MNKEDSELSPESLLKKPAGPITKVFAKRWVILAIFCCLSMSNAFQVLNSEGYSYRKLKHS